MHYIDLILYLAPLMHTIFRILISSQLKIKIKKTNFLSQYFQKYSKSLILKVGIEKPKAENQNRKIKIEKSKSKNQNRKRRKKFFF